MPAISTRGLSKHYGSIRALDSLDLDIPEGAVFGFLGLNGAGKTTTIRLLTGFALPTAGEAWVAGQKVSTTSLAMRARIGLLPDVPAFYDWMTGSEFMSLVGGLHHLTAAETRKRSRELLELVDLQKAANRRIGGYSRGMRQRLGIAQALMNKPSVLFMDEPTSALDPIGRREVLELIQRLRAAATIFMSTHILNDVERVCDLVGVIDKGRLVLTSTISDLQRQYARSVFEMEFVEDPAGLLDQLKRVDWLTDAETAKKNGGNLVRVRALDVKRASKELPRLAAASGLTLVRYELCQPTLEDIFLQVLGKEPGK